MVGRHLITMGLEYRWRVPLDFPASSFLSTQYNLGALWRNALDVKAEDFLHSIGIALSFGTALGPVSIAYGRVSDGRRLYYFSAGYAF